LATAVLVCTVPAIASASWFLTTQARNVGGSIVSDNGTQTVSDGAITKSYNTATPGAITVAPAAGNTVKSILLTARGVNALGNYSTSVTSVSSPYTLVPQDSYSYNVAATFQVSKLSVVAGNAGGTVSPSSVGNVYYGYTLQAPLTFTFAPMAGYSITSVTGIPAGATSNIPGGVNQRATVTLPAGFVFTGALDLEAVTVNTTPSINHILPQTVVQGSNVKLTASVNNIPGATYSWSYVSGPANTAVAVGAKMTTVAGPALTLNNAGTATANFTAPATAGQYKFLVTVGSQTSLATVNVLASSADSANQCQFCHTANQVPQPATGQPFYNIGNAYQASVHSGSTTSACSGCHYGTANGSHPGSVYSSSVDPITFKVTAAGATVNNHGTPTTVTTGNVVCTGCHGTLHETATLTVACNSCHMGTTSSTGVFTPAAGGTDAHNVQALPGCVNCHAVAQANISPLLVNDNSGVRAIIPEFQKTSHHIYNGPTALPVDQQCAICHLEGSVGNYGFGVDITKHMKDKYVHLRNANDDSEFLWDPSAANPDFTGMDNFCMNCHNANGAVGSTTATNGIKAIQAAISSGHLTPNKATAQNPFGDLLSNKYDQITRAQVVDVFSAMDPANASHHAVRAQKYSTRVTTSAMQAAGQKTLTDGGLFADYTPLGATQSVGDDSQLHCGDCHTVGQWINTNTKYNQAAIGAHGSNNEYLLRNNLGTDALHNGNTYVCFNCHNDYSGITAVGATVGGVVNTTATAGGYYAGYNAAGASPKAVHIASIHSGTNGDLQNTAGNVGAAAQAGVISGGQQQFSTTGRLGGNMLLVNGVLTSKGAVAGNITGIACINCHNSGLRSSLGGIHGGNATYSSMAVGTAPASATQKPYRFMGGMGNFRYTPPSNDLSNVANPNKPQSSLTGTCYTNANTTDNAGYSSCNHHGTGTAMLRQGGSVGNVARPLSY